MEKIKTILRTSDWEKVGIAAFYGYFAINILMKAFAYDHGDDIYKFFFIFAMKQAIQKKKPQIINNAFNNYFDHVTQKEDGHTREKVNYVQTLVETLMEMANAFNTMREEEINKVVDEVFDKAINILRYRKFLIEKGDD